MKIYIATHKKSPLPEKLDSNLYKCIQVGAALNEKFADLCDNLGESNISEKNPIYNELTATYWIWKNSTENIVGLCHYRRFFVTWIGKFINVISGKKMFFLTEAKINSALKKRQVIVHNLTFFAEGIEKQFMRTQNDTDIDIVRHVINYEFNDYSLAFEHVMKRKHVHLLNMIIAPKDLFDSYCEWLFAVLFKTEEVIRDKYPERDLSRAMGMLAERLLDVWLVKNKIKIKAMPAINTEKINWKVW